MNKKRILIDLFKTFFKIGLFTFGGGYAMIPLIEKEIVENKKWITEKDALDIIAISEATPGPISINMATFVGFKLSKVFGAIFSTFGLIMPPYFIILIISLLINEIENFKIVQYAFFGIRAGILALIIKAFFTMYKACPKNIVSHIIIVVSFILVIVFEINPIIVIILGAIIGILYSYICARRFKNDIS